MSPLHEIKLIVMSLGIKLLMQSKNNQTITLQNEIIQTIE